MTIELTTASDTTKANILAELAGVSESSRDQPNGFPGLDSNGHIVGTIIQRYDTAANLSSMVLAAGEFAYASDTGDMLVGDGSTMGGRLFYGAERHFSMPDNAGIVLLTNNPAVPTIVDVSIIPGATYELEYATSVSCADNTSNFAIGINSLTVSNTSAIFAPLHINPIDQLQVEFYHSATLRYGTTSSELFAGVNVTQASSFLVRSFEILTAGAAQIVGRAYFKAGPTANKLRFLLRRRTANNVEPVFIDGLFGRISRTK